MRQTGSPRFEVAFDNEAKLLLVSLSGFWTAATVASFLATIVPAAIKAKRRYGSFGVLSDLSDFAVQSGPVVKAFVSFMRATKPMNGGKIATVYPDTLTKLQVSRETPYDIRYFSDRTSALAWLTENNVASDNQIRMRR